MSKTLVACLLLCGTTFAFTQSGPSDPKAQKTYAEAQALMKGHRLYWALKAFKKADKQDGGQCLICEDKAYEAAIESGDFNEAAESAQQIISHLKQPQDLAQGHTLKGMALYREASDHHKEKLFADADSELKTALSLDSKLMLAHYFDGMVLAKMNRDEEARAQFQQAVAAGDPASSEQRRARRFLDRPELARARMAPPFSLRTIDNREVSLEDLAGKVVLIDFWATWCGPCREALPHVREIAKQFAGEPLVVLSISLDRDGDEQKWRQFVEKNEMTWMQARDGGFDGPIAKLFSVESIPHTFTIDADGVLQDEHIGDGSIEGKLKKQIARAKQLQPANVAKGQ